MGCSSSSLVNMPDWLFYNIVDGRHAFENKRDGNFISRSLLKFAQP